MNYAISVPMEEKTNVERHTVAPLWQSIQFESGLMLSKRNGNKLYMFLLSRIFTSIVYIFWKLGMKQKTIVFKKGNHVFLFVMLLMYDKFKANTTL